MLRRSGNRRAGVTLIELLVVVSILAVLMSLILAAVMRARGMGPRTETRARLDAVAKAIETFKSHDSFGHVNYIPPGRYEPVARPNDGVPAPGWYPFRLRNTYPRVGTAQPGEPDEYSFEAQYLQKVFGGGHQLNFADLGYRDNSGQPILRANLDGPQTLVFFLGGLPEAAGTEAIFTGFSKHPQQPFIRRNPNRTDENRRGPVLDLGGTRKYELDGAGFARLIDGYGNPFAYFAAYEGSANKLYGGHGNDQLVNTKGQPMGPVQPYARNGQYENSKGFQIISAGKNEIFGITGNWNQVGPEGEDDQASFAPALLGSGP
jgi:prepilin-type N-terminal cleavage/methylation domain-containing protein